MIYKMLVLSSLGKNIMYELKICIVICEERWYNGRDNEYGGNLYETITTTGRKTLWTL